MLFRSFNVGAGPWGDVLNIRVQINTAKTSVIRFEREYEAAGYGLAALIGLPDAEFPSQVRLETLNKESMTTERLNKPEPLIKEALAARPDIRRLEMVIKQAEAVTGLAKAPLYPKLQVAGIVEGQKTGDIGLSSEDFGNTVINTISEHIPNLKSLIIGRQVLSPLDIERDFGLSEGNIFQGELSLEQLFFLRPVAGWARYRTPVKNLYLCGSATHPGGGIMGASGRIAALELLKSKKLGGGRRGRAA